MPNTDSSNGTDEITDSPVTGATLSPTNYLVTGVTDEQNTTASPVVGDAVGGNTTAPPSVESLPTTSENGTSTFAPTQSSANTPTISPSSGELIPANNTLKSAIQNALVTPANDAANWTGTAERQLWLVKVAGITSRSGATAALLALQRACFSPSNNTSEQLDAGVAEINGIALPVLRTNRTACDDLLKLRDAEYNRVLREKLEFASASCALAIRAQEHLVDVSNKVSSGNISTGADCNALLTPKLLELNQYDTQTEQAQTTVSNIVLAALAGALGIILLFMHPLPGFAGTRFGFIVASGYFWAYVTFMAAWYAFDLSEADAWLSSTWWREYYSTYLLGLAGWMIFMLVCGILYFTMVRNPWFLGLWAGIAMGGIFGVQCNTLGFWQLGYNSEQPPYYALACCIGGGAGLWGLILIIWSSVVPTAGAIQHWCMVWIGSYLFVKMIGILVGNYPNEFDMSFPVPWETYVYIGCMWALAILVFVIQSFLYGITKRQPRDVAVRKAAAAYAPDASTRSSRSFGEEQVPLLGPVGNAADSRNLARQQEVTEFGGVRALRPDSENRRLYV